MKPLLQLSDIRKSFGAVRALKGVSFELLPGDFNPDGLGGPAPPSPPP